MSNATATQKFFEIFDKNELAFLGQEEAGSRFSKFVARENAG